MAYRRWKIGSIEVVRRPASKALKVTVIALIAFSTAALAALWWVRTDIMRQTGLMREEAAKITYENQVLEEKLTDTSSLQSKLTIAREELGMVSPDTILIKPQS